MHYIHNLSLLALMIWLGSSACTQKKAAPMPDDYRLSGAYIKRLPYFNPDSCVLLIRKEVPPQWQGAAYENLFLDGPEDSPLELGLKHLDYYEKNFPADTAREFAQLWRGRLLTNLGKLDSARNCLEESYKSSFQHGRYLRAGDAQEAMGHIYKSQGKSAEAIRAYLSVYEAIKNLDTTQNRRKTYAIFAIAAAFSQGGNHREALVWMQRARALTVYDQTPPGIEDQVTVEHGLSVIYKNLKMPDSALLKAKVALELHEKHHTIKDKSKYLHALGAAYLLKGECLRALRLMQEAQQSKRAKTNLNIPLVILSEMADAYRCLGQLDSAELLYKLALQSPAPTTRAAVQTKLSELYASRGQYQPAYDALQASREIRQKLFDDEKIQEMGAIKAEHELERSKFQLLELEQQRKVARLQNLLLALSLLLVLGAALSLLVRHRNHRRILEQEKQLAEAHALLQQQALERSEANLVATKLELDETAQLLKFKEQLVADLEMQLSEQVTAPLQPPGEAAHFPRMKILTHDDWLRFQDIFEQRFPGFGQRLKGRFSDLTNAETRLFLLLKLGFDSREMADMQGISIESIWRNRNRLRKKLGLAEAEDFDGFIRQF